MNMDIIALALVVVLIFVKLRSLLGTTPANEQKVRLSKESAEKLYNILLKEAAKQAPRNQDLPLPEELIPEEDLNKMSDLDKTLARIPNFNKNKFLTSAQNAFQVITEAFNKADTETLEVLVNKTIFKKFQEVINQRQQNNITAETDFICFDKTDIIKAEITKAETARLSVEFVSEQVNVLRDAEGNIIEGDENYIQNITDVWTFEKALTSTAPNWLLISTKK